MLRFSLFDINLYTQHSGLVNNCGYKKELDYQRKQFNRNRWVDRGCDGHDKRKLNDCFRAIIGISTKQ